MCLGCQCPQPIPPPNQTFKKCRLMLSILAVGLFVIGVIGLGCSQVFQFFYNLLLIYFLYIGWTTFNWCMTLIFFLFCTVQTFQVVILFVGMLQYNQLFAKNYIFISVYCLLQIVYYPIAIYFSHYCYRNFKQQFSQNGQMFPRGVGNNANNQPVANAGNYRRMDDDRQGQQPVFAGRNNQRQQNDNDGGNYFRGEGVRIG